MALRTVPFIVTEHALRMLRATHADFSRIPPPALRGRVHSGPLAAFGTYDFAQVRAQSEYLRLVSIVEAFVDTTCSNLFDLKTYGHEDFVRRLASSAVEQASSGWDDRKTAFKEYHSVSLGICASYSDVEAAVQVRNAIAHGLGRLTRRQQNVKTKMKISSAGVRIIDMDLIIDDAALARCLGATTKFVEDVDARIPR